MSRTSQPQLVPLAQIRTEGLQVRAETNRAHVDDLMELLGDEGTWPATLPPVIVFFDGKVYHLADGHHRCQAAQEAGCTEIPCEVHSGEWTAALWHALGANASHGLRRTAEDRRNAILTAYRLNPHLSNRAIAKACKVDEKLVRYHLAECRKASPPTAEISAEQTESASAGDWFAPNETFASTRTPWDTPEPDPVPPATAAPTRMAPMAGSTPASATAPAPPAPAPDIRVDAHGRQMDVSRIGKRQKADTPATAKEEATGAVKDALGFPCRTEAARKAMESVDFFSELDRHLGQAAKMIDRLGGMEGAELLRANHLKMTRETRDGESVERYHSADLTNIRRELAHWQPHTACPCCRETVAPGCQTCKGLGWIPKVTWDRLPEKLRQTATYTPETEAA